MTDIWSGGLAFSYFPATSSQGQFGIVNISSDGSTVTTGDDFSRLKTQYSEVSPPNSPTLSSAGPNTFSACPQENSTFLASSTLPPTPNDAACSCLESQLSCQFTPKTTNTSGIVGTLLDTACSLLGGTGGSCAAISANGTTGTYGSVAFCDPEVKLSFVMSEYYEATGRLATSCDFSGNATVNSGAPSSGATAAVTSCLANPSATFTPSAPTVTPGGSSTGTSSAGSSGSSNNKNGAVGLLGNPQALVGLGVACIFSVLGGVLTLS